MWLDDRSKLLVLRIDLHIDGFRFVRPMRVTEWRTKVSRRQTVFDAPSMHTVYIARALKQRASHQQEEHNRTSVDVKYTARKAYEAGRC